MRRKKIKFNTSAIRHLVVRMGRIGLKPGFLAIVLIVATAAYASYDLLQKISSASVTSPRISKQAGEKPASNGVETAAGEKPASNGVETAAGKKPAEAYQMIASRNLFGSTDKETAGTGGDASAASGHLGKTALLFDLLGTVAGGSDYSRAIIYDPEQKKTRIFKVGDQLSNAVIIKIMRRSIVLNVDGREEILMMKAQPSGPGGPVNTPPARSAAGLPRPSPGDRSPAGASVLSGGSGTYIKEFVALTQARPHFEGGKMDGYYLGNIEEGSLLRRLGLQSGDVVEGINDRNFTKPDDINQLQSMNFSPGTRNLLKVKRQGRSITLNLD